MVRNSSNYNTSERICYPFTQVWPNRGELGPAYTTATIIEALLVIPTSVENFLVVAGIWKTRSLHSPANFLICVLAISDMGVGIAVLPFHIAANMYALYTDFSPWCDATRIAYGIGVFFACVSLVTITAISIERVAALYWALTYESFASNNKVALFVIITWPGSALLSLLQYFDISTYKILAAAISFLCFVASTIGCFKIYQVVHHHRTQIRHQESVTKTSCNRVAEATRDRAAIAKRRKSSLAMLLLYGLFVLCYTPYVCVQLVMLFGLDNGFIQAWEITTVSIVFVNSVLNPLLYCWRMRDIRRAMMSLMEFFILSD
ncbi:predicted protein [Nematostella vectensis]|uniref:G-protein coupled receptors family 1 profile domain-containing protein n=1 Tax=Nematostella vectensis TaxID=45351 RepID=A7SJA6_NEMVE|nr:predicted protein [Nematostella vectensis]|eukprot:XP_001628247.1 predicted protein [Nematostella vectensis]